MKIALAFPGQGAQKIGLGKEFMSFPTYKKYFTQASEILGYDLFSICQSEKIHETKYTQVALFTASLATLELLELDYSKISLGFGLSLGEYTALVAGKKATFAEFLPIVEKRGRLMGEVSQKFPGKMVVTMKVPVEILTETIHEVNPKEVFICNFNTKEQIVIGGMNDSVDQVVSLLKEKGFKKLIPLKVSGAFHTPLLHEVVETLTPVIERFSFEKEIFSLLSNVTGEIHGTDFKEKLVQQIESPVKMEKMCDTLKKEGITHVLEIGCGNVVGQLVKKNQPEITPLTIDTKENLKAFKEWQKQW